jgi:hypothetical protein
MGGWGVPQGEARHALGGPQDRSGCEAVVWAWGPVMRALQRAEGRLAWGLPGYLLRAVHWLHAPARARLLRARPRRRWLRIPGWTFQGTEGGMRIGKQWTPTTCTPENWGAGAVALPELAPAGAARRARAVLLDPPDPPTPRARTRAARAPSLAGDLHSAHKHRHKQAPRGAVEGAADIERHLGACRRGEGWGGVGWRGVGGFAAGGARC